MSRANDRMNAAQVLRQLADCLEAEADIYLRGELVVERPAGESAWAQWKRDGAISPPPGRSKTKVAFDL